VLITYAKQVSQKDKGRNVCAVLVVPLLALLTLCHTSNSGVFAPRKMVLAVHKYCMFGLDSSLWTNWFHGGVRKLWQHSSSL